MQQPQAVVDGPGDDAVGSDVEREKLCVLANARSQGPAAVDTLVRELRPQMIRYSAAMGAGDPDDVVNEAFLRLHKRGDEVRFANVAAIRGYLRRSISNQLIDQARRNQSQPPPVELADTPLPDGPSFESQVADADYLRQLLRHLTPGQRRVIELRYLSDLTIEETAALTGKPLGTVKALQHRGLRNLRRLALVIVIVVAGLALLFASRQFDSPSLQPITSDREQTIESSRVEDEPVEPGRDETLSQTETIIETPNSTTTQTSNPAPQTTVAVDPVPVDPDALQPFADLSNTSCVHSFVGAGGPYTEGSVASFIVFSDSLSAEDRLVTVLVDSRSAGQAPGGVDPSTQDIMWGGYYSIGTRDGLGRWDETGRVVGRVPNSSDPADGDRPMAGPLDQSWDYSILVDGQPITGSAVTVTIPAGQYESDPINVMLWRERVTVDLRAEATSGYAEGLESFMLETEETRRLRNQGIICDARIDITDNPDTITIGAP